MSTESRRNREDGIQRGRPALNDVRRRLLSGGATGFETLRLKPGMRTSFRHADEGARRLLSEAPWLVSWTTCPSWSRPCADAWASVLVPRFRADGVAPWANGGNCPSPPYPLSVLVQFQDTGRFRRREANALASASAWRLELGSRLPAGRAPIEGLAPCAPPATTPTLTLTRSRSGVALGSVSAAAIRSSVTGAADLKWR